jgi:hypothetical protein
MICKQLIYPSSADKVVFREGVDGVSAVADSTSVVSHYHVRMMILPMGQPGNGIDKGDRLVIVLKRELAVNALTVYIQCPIWVQQLQQCADLRLL